MAKGTQAVTIPAKIQDVIMARVDSLPERAKILLQTAAVVGREFSHDLIKKVMDLPEEELLPGLSALKDAELLYERGVYPQSTYIFKHVLTQEVAFSSLLLKKRKEIHEKVGIVIEDLYSGRLQEFFELLASHCLLAEDWPRAYRYNWEAGLKAYSLSAYEKAQNYFENSLSALRKMPTSRARVEQEIDLCFKMRSVLFPIGRHEDWGKWVARPESLADKIGDNIRLANALNHLSNLHWMHGEPRKAMEVAKRALNLAEMAGDFSVQIACLYHLGMYSFNLGDYHHQVEVCRRVRALLAQKIVLQVPGLAGLPGAMSNSVLALGMSELGNFQEIDEIGREVLDLVEQGGNPFTRAAASNFLSMAYLRFKNTKRALQLLDDSYKQWRQYQMKAPYSFTLTILGHAYLLSNEPGRAQSVLEEATQEENFKSAYWLKTHLFTILAETYRALGRMDVAKETICHALETAGLREERGMEAWAMLVMAGIQVEEGKLQEALRWHQQGLKKASELFMRPLIGHLHKGLGEVYDRLGRKEEAQTELGKALAMYRTLGMIYWLDS